MWKEDIVLIQDVRKSCKKAQHRALKEALKDYGYNVTTLPIIIIMGHNSTLHLAL